MVGVGVGVPFLQLLVEGPAVVVLLAVTGLDVEAGEELVLAGEGGPVGLLGGEAFFLGDARGLFGGDARGLFGGSLLER